MLAGSTQQLLHPRKDSHLQEGRIPSAVSEPFSALCQRVCRRSVSQDKTHRFKNMVYTWPCHSPQSATELREKHIASVEDVEEKVISSSSVCMNR